MDKYYFYQSYYEALKGLKASTRYAIREAIDRYMFEDEEPEFKDTLSKSIWMLILPTLRLSKVRYANGKQTKSKDEANQKQNGSKSEANSKQNQSKAEGNPQVCSFLGCFGIRGMEVTVHIGAFFITSHIQQPFAPFFICPCLMDRYFCLRLIFSYIRGEFTDIRLIGFIFRRKVAHLLERDHVPVSIYESFFQRYGKTRDYPVAFERVGLKVSLHIAVMLGQGTSSDLNIHDRHIASTGGRCSVQIASRVL